MGLVERPVGNARFVKKEQRKAQGVGERYRAGHAPKVAFRDDSSSEDEGGFAATAAKGPQVDIEQKEDKRLERLRQQQHLREQQTHTRRRPVREAEVIEDDGAEADTEQPTKQPTLRELQAAADSDDSDDSGDRRRALARMKRAQNQQPQQNTDLIPQEEGSDEEYEEVSETDSEEQQRNQLMAKPMFVSKRNRATDLQWRKEEVEQQKRDERRELVIKNRRAEVTNMAISDTHRRETKNDEAESEGELPDDNDDYNLSEAEELWKTRKLKRFVRYKNERMQEETQKVEMERRRRLTVEQRKQEDYAYHQKVMNEHGATQRSKINFMQKYHHKGGFFQGTDEKGVAKEKIYNRDFNEATGVDTFNKEVLPEVMQVRGNDFGKRGRSKWTHLTNEDTTFQKDRDGNTMDNSFLTSTFAKTSSTTSANRAYQASENHTMFKAQKQTDVTQQALGSARFGVKDAMHRVCQ